MKKFTLTFLIFLFTFSINTFSQPTLNLNKLKKEIIDYHENGMFEDEMELIVNSIIDSLQFIINYDNPAVVLDIDETTLSNYSHIKECDFGYIPVLWNEWVDKAKAPPIPHILRLYDTLLTLNVSFFFITGRTIEFYEPTLKNLHEAGFTKVDSLIMREGKEKTMTATEYKSEIRKKIEEQGFNIILNVGDQMSDLEGGYAVKTVKLPNYMYYIE